MRGLMKLSWYVAASFAFVGIVHKDYSFASCCFAAMILCDLHTPPKEKES